MAGLCPDPLGELTTLPRLMAGYRGPTYKGQKSEEKKGGQEREGEGRFGTGGEGGEEC